MTDQKTENKKRHARALKLFAEFVDEFGNIDDKKLLFALIENYCEALDFIRYHRLFDDFEIWTNNELNYRYMHKTKKQYLQDNN